MAPLFIILSIDGTLQLAEGAVTCTVGRLDLTPITQDLSQYFASARVEVRFPFRFGLKCPEFDSRRLRQGCQVATVDTGSQFQWNGLLPLWWM